MVCLLSLRERWSNSSCSVLIRATVLTARPTHLCPTFSPAPPPLPPPPPDLSLSPAPQPLLKSCTDLLLKNHKITLHETFFFSLVDPVGCPPTHNFSIQGEDLQHFQPLSLSLSLSHIYIQYIYIYILKNSHSSILHVHTGPHVVNLRTGNFFQIRFSKTVHPLTHPQTCISTHNRYESKQKPILQ